MKTTVKLRNVELGLGQPNIAVPIVGKNTNEILKAATLIKDSEPDIVEWRIDFFDNVLDAKQLKKTGQQLRSALGDIALLTTFRTKGEGGALEISEENYFDVCENVLMGGFSDALDIERFHKEEAVKRIITEAHNRNVVVIMSNHDFDKTPTVSEIVKRLTSMVDCGADIAKIAVMPRNVDDVLTLLEATNIAHRSLSQPIITMSMGDVGKISRISGEVFGSCLSFATVGAASAPGQIALSDLKRDLEDLSLN